MSSAIDSFYNGDWFQMLVWAKLSCSNKWEVPMPEMRFQIEWPDGSQAVCYSPSLIVKEYFAPDHSYDLSDFVARSQTALTIASDRVKAKYGYPCGLALGQIQEIEATAAKYEGLLHSKVKVIKFIE
jgi:uncharacterized repeat protein (TIGR04042 family)